MSMNRTEISLKNMQGDPMKTCSTPDDKHRYELKSVIMPMRTAVISSGSSAQRGNGDQAATNRQAIGTPVHSYSSDSDGVPNSITATTATAMRRLYFKSAKLSKTTQNSITTVHQQQAQHVPKVNGQWTISCKKQFKENISLFYFKGYGNGNVSCINGRNHNQYINRIGVYIGHKCNWNGYIDL